VTGLSFGSILIITILCWVLLARSDAGQRRRPLLLFLSIAPFLLFSSVVVAAFLTAPAGEYRAALEAVSFRFSADDAVTVGGGTDGDDADDLIVRDLPPHYLTFRREGESVAAYLPPAVNPENDNPSYAAVRVDGERPFANSVLLGAGSTIGGREFDIGRRMITAAGTTYPAIPKRKQEFFWWSIPILRNLTAETAMYPLRFLARPVGAEDPATDRNGVVLGSFLSFDAESADGETLVGRIRSAFLGFFRPSLYLTLTGDGTEVTVGGKAVSGYQIRIAEIKPGRDRHFALYRLDYADPARGEESHSAAQERRSFRASYNNDRLSLVFDTPDIVRLPPESIVRLLDRQKEKGSFLLATRDSSRNTPIATNQMVLSFHDLGPRIQNESYSAMVITEKGDCALRVTTHSGTKCFDLGDAFSIGDDAAAIVRLTRIQIPWAMIATLFLLSFLSIGWPGWLEQNPGAVIIISAAEVLLAVRLLIAFEGGVLDASSAAALWESLAAYAMLPLTLRVAWLMGQRHASVRDSLLWLVTPEGRNVLLREIAISALVVMALLRANVALAGAIAVGAAVVLLPIVAAIVGRPFVERFTRPIEERAILKICVFGLAITAVRVLMWLGLGWKERIALAGADLAVTVLYLPVVFLFFALLWRESTRDASLPLSKAKIAGALAAGAIGVLLTIVLPYAVRDSGSVFVHLPAVLLLFAIPMLSRPTPRAVIMGVPLILLLLAHTVILLVPRLRGGEDAEPSKNRAYQRALASESEAEQFLALRLKASANDLRLMSQIAPHQLEEAGTLKAEGLVAQRRMLDRYSGRGILGAGFLNVPLAVFRSTHLNDNLSAIHILAPFGILGGAAVLALLAALAILPLYSVLRSRLLAGLSPEDTVSARSALGIISLWTFCVAGIYMFAANVGLVLFTGKNVYLLAAASKSDAVEGGVLLLIALLSLTVNREAEPAP